MRRRLIATRVPGGISVADVTGVLLLVLVVLVLELGEGGAP